MRLTESRVPTTLRVGRALDRLLDPLELPTANGRATTTNGTSIDSGVQIDLAPWTNGLAESHARPRMSAFDVFARTRYRLLNSERSLYRVIREVVQLAVVGVLSVSIISLLLTMIR